MKAVAAGKLPTDVLFAAADGTLSQSIIKDVAKGKLPLKALVEETKQKNKVELHSIIYK